MPVGPVEPISKCDSGGSYGELMIGLLRSATMLDRPSSLPRDRATHCRGIARLCEQPVEERSSCL